MATYPTDATSLFTTDTFTDMSDRKPDRGYATQREYNTIVFETESGYEKRRLRSRRAKRSYDLKYTNVTGVEKYAIENFYNNRSGNFESFYLDLAHINEAGTVRVRFDGAVKIDHVLSTGDNLLQNFYSVSFTLKETYD
jgi:hypothetical protein